MSRNIGDVPNLQQHFRDIGFLEYQGKMVRCPDVPEQISSVPSVRACARVLGKQIGTPGHLEEESLYIRENGPKHVPSMSRNWSKCPESFGTWLGGKGS